MMLAFTIFDSETGAVVSNLIVTDAADAELNVSDGQVLVEGDYPAEEWRLVDGAPVEMPAKPGPLYLFDYEAGEWVDGDNPAERLAASRASATMSRSDFLLAAISAGIIPASDAGPAARGEIPSSISTAFETLDAEVQIEATVRWGAATVIERNSAVLLAIAAAMGVTDEQLDALFGIAA